MLLVAGERHWGQALVQQAIEALGFKRPLWVSDEAPKSCWRIEKQQARQLLGQEIDCLVYDAWAGLDPDALAAVSGALSGGGLLLLLTPPMAQWPAYRDPDYQRLLVHPFTLEDIAGRFIAFFQQSLLMAGDIQLIEQGEAIEFHAETSVALPPTVASTVGANGYCLGEDQAAAVAAVIKVLQGHRRRPLVMTADRGRGKSSALGIASAEILREGVHQLLITAPRLASVQPVFEHAARVLQLENNTGPLLQFGDSSLRFVAPDELLHAQIQADLLLVDEAAAIPAAMLAQYLQRYSRIVFSTTVHGYEGTGRGFDIRFRKTLDSLTPQWKSLQLSTPIRWAENDPLERCLFDALLLDAKVPEGSQLEQLTAKHCVIERLDRDQLLTDKHCLGQIFALLVLAHYQTTPSDLRNLLDGPNISIWVSRFQGEVVAAALVAAEGGFDTELSSAIWRAERRPRGHLLPQTLCVHGGLQRAPEFSYQRIMRIAVHPAVQRRGLAGHLMAAIIEQARGDGCDFIGSSFAATADVLAFWRSQHCVPVRLGVSRDASSGCYSAVVLSALSVVGSELLESARQRFCEQFPRELMSLYQQLDVELVIALLNNTAPTAENIYQQLTQQDWLDIEAFTLGYRQYEMCLLPLWKLLVLGLSQKSIREQLSASQQVLLVARILQNQPLKTVADNVELTGKKQLLAAMREAIKIVLNTYSKNTQGRVDLDPPPAEP